MRNIFILFLLVASSVARAQQAKPLTEETPFSVDGIEYGYSIKNVNNKEVSNKDFSRYEVTLYATNKSECSRIVLFGQSLNQFEFENRTLAKFDCVNATGARLTSKTGEVNAKPMYVIARVTTKDDKCKTIIENQKVHVGYYIGAGETVQENVIFIVPLNSKPDIKLRIVNHVSTL